MTVHVRLVTWNCKAGGRDKLPAVCERFRPDILVLPEYANYSAGPGVAPDGFSLTSLQWKRYRPLVVLAREEWTLSEPVGLPSIGGGIILPVEISGPVDFRLVAVAAALSKPTPEVNPVVDAAKRWANWLEGPVVVAGDFGTGWPLNREPKGLARWRNKPPALHHNTVLEALASLDLRSAYHAHFGVAQGEEPHATYWQNHREDKPFHIDHVFTSPDLTVEDLDVGAWEDFHTRSDHAPMFVDLMRGSA